MTTSITDFNYNLPKKFIAQTPADPRESAKLMVLSRNNGAIKHKYVGDLPSFFHAGDVIVINNTKVFHARLHGTIGGKTVELFLVRPQPDNTWLALGKPGKKFVSGSRIVIANDFTGVVKEKFSNGTFTIELNASADTIINKANAYGEVPVPPYIKKIPKDSDYQTIYAKYNGSVAAPTAGFHFSKELLSAVKQIGVTILEITLHVGIGTFMPIKSETIESHEMHSEWVEVKPDVSHTILQAKNEGRRIIAIGTTTVRTLEGTLAKPYSGDVNLFIKPGFKFQIVDAMLTNFHLPKSTLIVLVSAFACPPSLRSGAGRRAGREMILRAYQEAINNNYRFYSFGDAMLIM
jgi:S-adenosylmethionine:tRNA ribosyltransferase-isomerase